MSKKIQIIKRLEIIKNLIELEDEESIHIQIEKLKSQNDNELDKIIQILENDDYTKINKAIDEYVHSYKNAKLTPHQQKVFDAILKDIDEILSTYKKTDMKTVSEHFISLSGSAGTGKTFVTSKLVEEFLKKDYKILLTTPTHKSLKVAKYMIMTNNSNLHVNTRTLHSYLDISLKEDFVKGTKAFKRSKDKEMYDFEKNLDILLVDESSMVSNELLTFIEENLQQNKLKSVLFIGDQYQLPPVDEGQNGVVSLPKQYRLTEILRQSENSYIKLIANEIKECIKNQKFTPIIDILNKTKYPELSVFYDEEDFLDNLTNKQNWYDNSIVLSYTNSQVSKFNNILRYKYWKEKDNIPEDFIVQGDKLIFNSPYKKIIQNSQIVSVLKAIKEFDEYIGIYYYKCTDTLGRNFKVVDKDSEKDYNEYLLKISKKANKIPKDDKEERKKAWKHYFATKNNYADVKYTYANTIHKSQGSTYTNVYIDINSIQGLISYGDKDMAYRLLYVAITRASRDIKILL